MRLSGYDARTVIYYFLLQPWCPLNHSDHFPPSPLITEGTPQGAQKVPIEDVKALWLPFALPPGLDASSSSLPLAARGFLVTKTSRVVFNIRDATCFIENFKDKFFVVQNSLMILTTYFFIYVCFYGMIDDLSFSFIWWLLILRDISQTKGSELWVPLKLVFYGSQK